jgi:hypothetical protein
MKHLTKSNREQLLRNGEIRRNLDEQGDDDSDFLPVVKPFTPDANCRHLSLGKDSPVSRAVESIGWIISTPLLGGLDGPDKRPNFRRDLPSNASQIPILRALTAWRRWPWSSCAHGQAIAGQD